MNQIRISGKNLGQLALRDFCPRCFWVRLKCGEKLPFQIFPGVFASIDSFSKKITNSHFRMHGRIPSWFAGFEDLGQPIKALHHSTFNTLDEDTGILLTGVPDEVFRHADKSLFIADYKTARHTDHQDELLPMYSVQLNSYAVIAERIALGKVHGLGLVYYEPPGDIDDEALCASTLDDGFVMRFGAKLLTIPLEPATILPLLRKVREIHDMATAPDRRPECKDCRLLDRLVEVVNGSKNR